MAKRRALHLFEEDTTESNAKTLKQIKTLTERYFDSRNPEELSDDTKLLPLLYLQFGFDFVEQLRLVFSVVPIQCGPWRKELTIDLLQRVRKNCDLSESEVKAVNVCLKSNLASPTHMQLQPQYSQSRLALEKMELDTNVYGGCICPPTCHCYSCGNELAKNNKR